MTDFMSFACRCENLMHYYKGSLSLLIHLFWPLVLHNKAVKVSIKSPQNGSKILTSQRCISTCMNLSVSVRSGFHTWRHLQDGSRNPVL